MSMSSITEINMPIAAPMVSIPVDSMSSEEIERVISLLKVELIARKSHMTQVQADEIAQSIKTSWWEKNKDRILTMIGENE